MITVKCQHTGFEFEAETSRSKNHPQVAAFLNEASKEDRHYRGASRTAKQLVSEATGYDNIDELMSDVRNAYEAWKTSGKAAKVVKTHKQMVVEYNERQAAWRRGAEQREYDASNRGDASTKSQDALEDW